MASAEKFCKLLAECAEQHIPVVCFISSGGMQTKEAPGRSFQWQQLTTVLLDL